MNASIFGLVRSGAVSVQTGAGQQGQLGLNAQGDLLVTQALPSKAQMVASGMGFYARNSTGVAAASALPAITASQLTLYNGEAVTGKSYIIDRINVNKVVTDATQQDNTSIYAEVSGVGIETAPTDASNAKGSLSGKGTYAGKARMALSQTVVGSAWMGLGYQQPMATAFAGAAWASSDILLDGLFVIPPTGELNLAAVDAAAAAALQMFYTITWFEAVLALG